MKLRLSIVDENLHEVAVTSVELYRHATGWDIDDELIHDKLKELLQNVVDK